MLRHSTILLVLAAFLFPLVHGVDEPNPTDRCPTSSELEELRSKIARLEYILENSGEMMSLKMSQLNEKMHYIQELEVQIRNLQNSLDDFKQPLKDFSNRGSAEDMEEEVRLLWAKMRENNFDIYLLETKAEDAESKFKSVHSQLQEIKDIVTEQWIQIRHLEQALEMTKIKNSKSQRRGGCSFLKFFEDLRQGHLLKYIGWKCYISSEEKKSVLWPLLSKMMNRMQKMASDIKGCHHMLQHSVKNMLESNENVAAFALEELAFILASGIVILPMLPIIFLFVTLFNR